MLKKILCGLVVCILCVELTAGRKHLYYYQKMTERRNDENSTLFLVYDYDYYYGT